jgi:hypothetical protein
MGDHKDLKGVSVKLQIFAKFTKHIILSQRLVNLSSLSLDGVQSAAINIIMIR